MMILSLRSIYNFATQKIEILNRVTSLNALDQNQLKYYWKNIYNEIKFKHCNFLLTASSSQYEIQEIYDVVKSNRAVLPINNFKSYLQLYIDINLENHVLLHVTIKQLFQCISFKQNARSRGKIQAIVAGSFPAYLARYTKRFNDIDIFLLFENHNNPLMYQVIQFIKIIANLTNQQLSNDYDDGITDENQILYVLNIGRLQFILRRYIHCDCIAHIDNIFFKSFHHITRWKLYIYTEYDKLSKQKKDIAICVYIPYNKHIITEQITFPEKLDNKRKKRYPFKHLNNRCNKYFYPPSLFQQALIKLQRMKGLSPMVIEK